MIVYYGTKGKEVLRKEVFVTLPEKGDKIVNLYVFARYAHLYWIPFFSTGKMVVAEDSATGETWEGKEMPAELKPHCQQARAEAKTPKWFFSGLALIGLLALFLLFSSHQGNQRTAEYIAAPKVGDIIEYKIDGTYTIAKVIGVEGENVTILESEWYVDRRSGLKDLRRDSFVKEPFVFTVSDLQEELKSGIIIGVDR